jgi:hypothetical protein
MGAHEPLEPRGHVLGLAENTQRSLLVLGVTHPPKDGVNAVHLVPCQVEIPAQDTNGRGICRRIKEIYRLRIQPNNDYGVLKLLTAPVRKLVYSPAV